MLRKNVASQVITFNLVNATNGAPLTGATVTTKVTLDGTQSASAGTVTELGTGQYKYVPTQGETNGASVGVSFTASNAVPVNLHCFTIGQDPALATFDSNITKLLGTAWLTPGTAGTPDVNVKLWNALTTVELPLVPLTAGRKLDVTAANKVNGVVLTDTLTTYTGNTPQTGDSFAIVNSVAHGNAALKTLIDTVDNFIDTEVQAIIDAIVVIDDFLDTEVAAILAAVDTEVAAIKAKTDSLAFTVANQVDANPLSINGSAPAAVQLAAHAIGALRLVVDAGSSTTAVVFKTIDGAVASATNDFYKGRFIVFTSGALAGQATSISSYVGATKTATVAAVTGAPADTVTGIVV